MLAFDNPFYSSKFSIDWAQNHITELEGELEALAHPDCYTTVTEPDADGVYNLFKFKMIKPLTRGITGHTLDVIYNLRAALDQAIYSVTTLNNTPSERSLFPITNSPAWFEKSLKKLIQVIPQEIADVVRAFKPYKGGNNLIWALNEICNTNKHGIIQPLPMAVASMAWDGTSTGNGPQILISPVWDRAKNEMILARSLIGAEFTVNYDVTVEIVFSDIEFIKSKPVIYTLYDFLDIVEGVVMAIEAESSRIGLI